ncbi:hypothetical protein G9A89_023388 [Geosiphon pyriformis]|nr:hypothetical protein G9A89_023388 [Geosiphon pyriformis]
MKQNLNEKEPLIDSRVEATFYDHNNQLRKPRSKKRSVRGYLMLLIFTLVALCVWIGIRLVSLKEKPRYFSVEKNEPNLKSGNCVNRNGYDSLECENKSAVTAVLNPQYSSTGKLGLVDGKKENVTLEVKSSTGIKLKITNEEFLRRHQKYAWHAMRAYCPEFMREFARGVFADIILENGEIIVRVKGDKADNPSYWSGKRNTMTPLQRYPGVKVDDNFYQQYLATNNDIANWLFETITQNHIYKITAVGHGIGGVHATFLILDFLQLYQRTASTSIISVVTFGQPHIGDRNFAKTLNNLGENIRFYRFTHRDDYIPRISRNVYDEYFHQKTEYWIDSSCDCPTSEVYQCEGPTIITEGESYTEESQECINQYSLSRYESNNGPYLNVLMGSCFDSYPSFDPILVY